MLEKIFENLTKELPFGLSNLTFSDFLFLLILIIFILLILNQRSKKKIRNKISEIPGLKLSEQILGNIATINSKLQENDMLHNTLDLKISQFANKLKKIKKIETIQYNPYADMGVGGNQSFSTAIVDGNGDGVIITCLYSREKTRTMVKVLKNFVSDKNLSEEEKEVLRRVKSTSF